MDTTKNIERGARLGEFLDRKMLNKKEFSTITGISPSMISFYVLGSQPFTGRLIEAMTEFYPDLSLDWLYHGRGEMIKHNYAAETNEEIPLEQTFFNQNLPVLMRAFETDDHNLSSLIVAEQSTLNDLLNGIRGPSLRVLIRLRDLWGVPIDDMLFTDLTHPGTMEDLKEKAGENLQIKQTLEKVLEKLEDLDKRDREKDKKIEKLAKTLDDRRQDDG